MAVTTEQFNADGTLTDFTVPSEILSKSHVRVDFYYDALDHEITAEQWDVFGSTVVFATAPTNGYVVKITTSTDGSGLDTPPSVAGDVAAIAAEIVIVAGMSTDISTIAPNIGEVTTVAADLAKGIGTNQVTDSSILNALTNANLAIASASAALVSETNLSISEANSAASAAAALVSENNAAASEVAVDADATQTALAVIATAADAVSTAADRVAVETLYDDYDARYLGSKASDPTLDNDGNPLLTGATYWNTTNDLLMFYNGAAWESPDLSASQSATAAASSETNSSTSAANALASELAAGVNAAKITSLTTSAIRLSSTDSPTATYTYVDDPLSNSIEFGIPAGVDGVDGVDGLYGSTPVLEFTYNATTGDIEYNVASYIQGTVEPTTEIL